MNSNRANLPRNLTESGGEELLQSRGGKRKRGRPKNSWRRDTEEEMRSISTSWQDLRKKAQRRVQWKNIIGQKIRIFSSQHHENVIVNAQRPNKVAAPGRVTAVLKRRPVKRDYTAATGFNPTNVHNLAASVHGHYLKLMVPQLRRNVSSSEA
ncbi:hypothetical protein Bbelb_312860 [Branchiostoma belcheri]|nr:hypothetical protein Bbelb_312860 [Branchiostoma belcheri]